MQENPYHPDREEIKELLKQYQDLKTGRQHSFLEEEAFERIIDYFDDTEDLAQAIEAVELGIEQYPYSSALLVKKADLLIATRHYYEALNILEQAELLDGTRYQPLHSENRCLSGAGSAAKSSVAAGERVIAFRRGGADRTVVRTGGRV